MLFLISKVHIISIQQIEQFWCLETYKLFVPAEKQLAHPLFSSNSVCILAWPQWGSFADINQQEVVFAKIGKISFEFDCNFNVKQTHEKSLICTIACEFWQRCRLISNSRINYFLCIVPPSSYFNELRKLTRKKNWVKFKLQYICNMIWRGLILKIFKCSLKHEYVTKVLPIESPGLGSLYKTEPMIRAILGQLGSLDLISCTICKYFGCARHSKSNKKGYILINYGHKI